MKTIHIHTTFAKLAALASLAVLALLAASCTDQYDPAEVSPAAMAGAPIAISVAPPPAFTEVAATTRGNTAAANDRQPATRASQTDKGTKWEAGDVLWLTAEFFKDKATAANDPADVIHISILKYTGTDWHPLSQQEAEEFGVTSLPNFVRQLHWPKEVMEGDNPAMAVKAIFWGNGKPDANGIITIKPNKELPTTVILASSGYTWYYPDDVSPVALDKLNHFCSRLRIPAGYRAELTHAHYWTEYHLLSFYWIFDSIEKIPAQTEDTDVFLIPDNRSTVKLINVEDNTSYSYTFPSITNAEGEATRAGASYTFTPYSNGTETPLTPGTYDLLISNEEELRAFAEKVNKDEKITGLKGSVPAREAKVLQTANITLSSEEWTPIGYQFSFKGRYNGNGHTIENMTITKGVVIDYGYQKTIYAGLFGSLEKAVLTGINLRDVRIGIDADNTIEEVYAGSIAGSVFSSTLSLCTATGEVIVRGDAKVALTGGIAGDTFSPGDQANTISRCRATVKVEAITRNAIGYTYAGGIVGENGPGSFILSCETQGETITAEGGESARAGGITGRNVTTSIIAFCHAGNTVNAQKGNTNYAGGLIGNNIGYLYASYATDNATATSTGGKNYAGILVGYNNQADRVQHCYGAGTASPDNHDPAADANNIVYNRNPAGGEILTLMQMHTDAVETIPNKPDYYPITTHYDPSASPAYGIEPIRVKWSSSAWKQGSDPKYPEIDREYQGE